MKKIITKTFASAMLISLTAVSAQAAELKVGDYLKMGSMYGEDILWRCVSVDENGPLMLTDEIITTRSFDAAGTHENDYRGLRRNFGSNLWEKSNLRSWLNSDEEKVTWVCGNAPVSGAVWGRYNAYDDEPGFLTGFDEDEEAIMKEVSQKQILSYRDALPEKIEEGTGVHISYSAAMGKSLYNYDTAYSYKLSDKVFVLDMKQAYSVYENGEILGEKYYIGKMSQKCAENNEYIFEGGAGGEWHTWLRTPYATSKRAETVRILWSNGWVERGAGWLSYIGVRPAFYADAENVIFDGSGSLENPYTVK